MTAISFSGGKDSTVLLHMMRERASECQVYWADSGASFPHVREFVTNICQKWGFQLKIVKPPYSVMDHIERFGLPVDILPVDYFVMNKPIKLQGYNTCCGEMLWIPTYSAIKADEHREVFRGVKKSDKRRPSMLPETTVDGITYHYPLWDLTDEDVYSYIEQYNIKLPAHYEFVNDSLDCWICTAHIGSDGFAKYAYIREHFPMLWKILALHLRRVKGALMEELEKVMPALSQGDE